VLADSTETAELHHVLELGSVVRKGSSGPAVPAEPIAPQVSPEDGPEPGDGLQGVPKVVALRSASRPRGYTGLAARVGSVHKRSFVDRPRMVQSDGPCPQTAIWPRTGGAVLDHVFNLASGTEH
jgi:hypothetical protein